MTNRGDVRNARRAEPIGYLVLAFVLAAAVAVLVEANAAADLRQMNADIAEANAWTFAAPPCPRLSLQAYLANARRYDLRILHAFEFGGVKFGRGYGDVSCTRIHADGGRSTETLPVCQFSGPGVLEISTSRGAFYFFPSAGPATVAVPHGQPQCVLGETFRD